MQKKDFFISYAEADEKWATWIAGVLEGNDYTTYLRAWDFKSGENFVLNMHNALIYCERFIAVLSAEYMQKVYCQAEWTAAFTKDPACEKGLFIPIRIEDYKPEGLFAPIIYLDLFGIDEKEAEGRLKQIDGKGRPRNKPGFPGTKKARFPGQLPFNNIPYTKNVNFTGRKEILDQMINSLKPGGKNACSLVLCGLGAVGKTQIALTYAINHGYLYDTIWWVDAENEWTILDSYKDLLLQKEIIEKDIAYERKDILQSVWGWMSQNPNWLFIYDNAEKETDLAQYLPRSNTGYILVTTRDPNWFNIKRIEVDVFQAEEAVEFLKRFELEGSIGDAKILAEELGYLPLALDQAAAYMLEIHMSYQEYIDLFQKYRLKLLGIDRYHSLSDYKDTVTTTWNLSLEKIDKESAKQLIHLFAFLAPEHIPKDMFIQTQELLPEPLASDVRDELIYNDIIANLTQYSLIQIDKGGIRIHRLLQEVIRQSLGNMQVQYFQYCVRILRKVFAYDKYDMKTWENCVSLMSHVQLVLTHEEDLKTETQEIAGLYAEGARWLEHTALYKEALEWYERALAIIEKIKGFDHLDTATIYNNIAFIYGNQGKYKKAMEKHEKALEIREKVLGIDNPDTATTYNNIAFIYDNQGKYKEALEWYERALAIREKVLGTDHPDTATSYNNIAGIYRSQGKYEVALEWYEKALAIREKVLGIDHPDTATTYNNIAFIYDNQGKYKEALEWYEKALAIQKRTMGSDHPNTATMYNNIAIIYCSYGEYDKAYEWFKKALSIREKVLGSDHPDTAGTYNNIAVIYYGQGKYEKALEWYGKALTIQEKVFGTDHPDTIMTYNNIARIYERQGK